jgi:adenylate cyclase
MPLEIERKFLVVSDAWRKLALTSEELWQGYLAMSGTAEVRIRCAEDTAYLTIKGAGGMVRREFEYAIPLAHGREMLNGLCQGHIIHKTRHDVMIDDRLWEVDEFHGEHLGLIVAEVELDSAEQVVTIPDWVGEEVTDDRRFRNSSLARDPTLWRRDATV